MSRFLIAILFVSGFAVLARGADASRAPQGQPNVLIVITDDQGFGDIGVHGNPVVKTPNIDAFARESVWLKNFYVSPVCAPTRSSLLTGRYNYRTGVVDTFIGRALMRPGIPTLPEHLAAAGYRTGLFGKWHLGDNYPLRPEDRGFQETLWSQGGGIAQPSDPPQQDPKTAYFNPILRKNGQETRTKGYCTDMFTDAALGFITADAKKPFFAYVAFNAPHSPYQVPDELAAHYRKRDLTAKGFPKVGQPWATPKLNTEAIAGAYGMIENIDANFGRLLKALTDKGIAENTIVIFLTDNGPGGVRWNAGLRNRKGSVYEGGIRVPCYIRWPKELKGGRVVDTPLAHIDIMPTLVEACGAGVDDKAPGWDGRSFLTLLRQPNAAWANRTLFFQWHRGDVPEKNRAFTARGARYKLVQANGVAERAKWQPKFELFDLSTDPFEEKDLAAEKPEVVAELQREYEAWFADVTKLGFDPPRIVIGSAKENPVRLTRQDWRGPKAGWTPQSIGHWELQVERAGKYQVTVRSRADFDTASGTLGVSRFQGVSQRNGSKVPTREMPFLLELHTGPERVEVIIESGGKTRGPDYVELKYVGPAEKK